MSNSRLKTWNAQPSSRLTTTRNTNPTANPTTAASQGTRFARHGSTRASHSGGSVAVSHASTGPSSTAYRRAATKARPANSTGMATRGSGSRTRPCLGRSSKALSAGLRVSELNADSSVEMAMVTANWRKNWPRMPLMNRHGTNTAASTRPTAMTGPDTSRIAASAASRGARPASMWCSTASTTTMASSTMMPTARTRPKSVSVFRL